MAGPVVTDRITEAAWTDTIDHAVEGIFDSQPSWQSRRGDWGKVSLRPFA